MKIFSNFSHIALMACDCRQNLIQTKYSSEIEFGSMQTKTRNYLDDKNLHPSFWIKKNSHPKPHFFFCLAWENPNVNLQLFVEEKYNIYDYMEFIIKRQRMHKLRHWFLSSLFCVCVSLCVCRMYETTNNIKMSAFANAA